MTNPYSSHDPLDAIRDVNLMSRLRELEADLPSAVRAYRDATTELPPEERSVRDDELSALAEPKAPLGRSLARLLVLFALRNRYYGPLREAGIPIPAYNHQLTFEENAELGPPEGAFDSVTEALPILPTKLAGFKLNFPFGVSACAPATSYGPHNRFLTGFASVGFDIITYKSVRDAHRPPNKAPHWGFAVGLTHQVLPGVGEPIEVTSLPRFDDPSQVSMVNSFGVPSVGPDTWIPDVKATKHHIGRGQVFIVSVLGHPEITESDSKLAHQFANAAEMAVDAGADIIELNLSCPNTGHRQANADQICKDPAMSAMVVRAVQERIGGRAPVFIKISFLDHGTLGQLLAACTDRGIPERGIQGVVAINTFPVRAIRVGAAGLPPSPDTQFFPDSEYQGASTRRAFAGLSGAAIRTLGLDMARRLAQLRTERGYEIAILASGGVSTPPDFQAYREAGADAVLSCTGAWNNTRLAIETRRQYGTEPSSFPTPVAESERTVSNIPSPESQSLRTNLQPVESLRAVRFSAESNIKAGILVIRELEQEGSLDVKRLPTRFHPNAVLSSDSYERLIQRLKQRNIEFEDIPVVAFSNLSLSEQRRLRRRN
ncbi:MAG: hypothetical protein ACKVVP_07255 [Chloroflexota bacterium]